MDVALRLATPRVRIGGKIGDVAARALLVHSDLIQVDLDGGVAANAACSEAPARPSAYGSMCTSQIFPHPHLSALTDSRSMRTARLLGSQAVDSHSPDGLAPACQVPPRMASHIAWYRAKTVGLSVHPTRSRGWKVGA